MLTGYFDLNNLILKFGHNLKRLCREFTASEKILFYFKNQNRLPHIGLFRISFTFYNLGTLIEKRAYKRVKTRYHIVFA